MSGVKKLLITFIVISVLCLILFILFIYGITSDHQPRKNQLELESKASYVSERNGNLEYSLKEYLSKNQLVVETHELDWHSYQDYFDDQGYLKERFYTQDSARSTDTQSKIYRVKKIKDPLISTQDLPELKRLPEGCDSYCFVANQHVLPLETNPMIRFQMNEDWLYVFPQYAKIAIFNDKTGFEIIDLVDSQFNYEQFRIADQKLEVRGGDFQQKYPWLSISSQKIQYEWRTAIGRIKPSACKQSYKTVDQYCSRLKSCRLQELSDPYTWYNPEAGTASKKDLKNFEAKEKIEQLTHKSGLKTDVLIQACQQVCQQNNVRYKQFEQQVCQI